jgi:hypothetical protein
MESKFKQLNLATPREYPIDRVPSYNSKKKL